MSMHVVWLALIQGITEFLPVSSSGHLILFAKYSGFADQGQMTDIALHVGSLFAVIIYFWNTIQEMIISLWKNKFLPKMSVFGVRLAYLVVAATIPAIFIGGIFEYLGMDWVRNVKLIGWTLILYSFVLWYADMYFSTEKTLQQMNFKEALLIGLAQCLAFLPGTSRSGITITVGRFMGFNRSEVAKFSMLLSIPSIIAAGSLTLYSLKNVHEEGIEVFLGNSVILSFLFSLMAIFLMMKWLRYKTYLPFVIYRILLGSILLLSAYGVI